jgi:DNA-binding SARP family transcriptional activator
MRREEQMRSEPIAEPPVRLGIRLLGTVEVVLDGEPLSAFNSLRLQRFLALVALRREPQHRARLAFELWPDSGEAQARTNLRKLLHELRRTVPGVADLVDTDGDTIQLGRAGGVDVDVWRFREAIAVGDLDLAVRAYTGDLVSACYDDWILDERARLRTEAHRASFQLAEDAAGRDDHDATVRLCERVLAIEASDEPAAALLMRAHMALDNRAAALRAYHRCADTLEHELAVTPGDALRELYQTLQTDPLVADEGVRNVEPISEPGFVGRDPQLRQLRTTWERTCDGHARLVLITGDPGIGKSRLAAELGRRVRRDGHVVAAARAYEAAGRPPWAPVIDLLRSDELQSDVAALEPAWRDELTRLLPELTVDPDRVRPAGDLAQRYRLFDAVGRAVVGERPRLLIIDDLQWCDADTIEMIGFIVRSKHSAPVLVVGTLRSEHVDDEPLTGVTAALERDEAVTIMHLDPLDEAATAAIAAGFVSTDAGAHPDLAARLWSETGGNPLFAIEALRAGFSAEDDRPALTPTMRSVVLGRLRQLPAGAQRIAEVASVFGRPFSVGLVASAAGLEEDEVVDLVDELWRRRIVSDQGSTYDFTHDALRAVALENMSPARRRQLHRAVAESMALDRHDHDEAAARLAAHYDEAGMTEAAVDAYHRAGRWATSVSALDEAVSMFRRAISLLADLAPTTGRDALELDLRVALGSPLVALEGYGSVGAHRLYERASLLCRKLGRPVEPPILRGLGLARLQGCRFDESTRLARALLDHAGDDSVARTEGWYLLGVSEFWRGDLAAARSSLERAVDTYDTAHRDEHLALYAQDPLAVCLVRLAWAELWAGEAGRAVDTVESARQLATAVDHVMTSNYVLTYAAIIAAECDDLPRLGELLGELEQVWSRLPMPYLEIVGNALRGWLEVCEGTPGGIERIVAAVTGSRPEGETLHLTYCLRLLARARGAAGEFREGRAAAREALAWSHQRDQRYLEAEVWRIDGELAFRSGEPAAAADSLHRAIDVASAQGARWLEMRALHSLLGRFPDSAIRQQLADVLAGMPAASEVAAFRAAATSLDPSM